MALITSATDVLAGLYFTIAKSPGYSTFCSTIPSSAFNVVAT